MRSAILGMAFKAESDDNRAMLSYKLKQDPAVRGASEVLSTDPFVANDPELVPVEEVLARSNLLFVGTPHTACMRPRTGKARRRHLEPVR